jgi:hypothetical protein
MAESAISEHLGSLVESKQAATLFGVGSTQHMLPYEHAGVQLEDEDQL